MVAEPRVVSLWSKPGKQGRLCSGLLLSGRHILTVKHAFVDWKEKQPIYVRLIDGVDGDVEALLFQRHRERDAALLELTSAVGDPGFPALQTKSPQSLNGKSARLLVIDPDTHGRATPTNYSIASHDYATGEYVLSPENAKGHSGGVVEVDGKIIGLLSRRTQDDPLCRAVAMHLLWEWIRSSLGDHNAMPMHAPAATENRIIQACSVLAKEGQVAEGVNRMAGNFDVFLSHNSQDKPAVRELAKALGERGLMVWLDEEQLQPGLNWQPGLEKGIRQSGSAAVLIGGDGLGPWQDAEMQALLNLAVKEDRPVIPVLLPSAPEKPELPLFLQSRTWVDLRPNLNQHNLGRLVWGITGSKPEDMGAEAGEQADELVEFLGKSAAALLSRPGTRDLQRISGFPNNAPALAGHARGRRFQLLVADLFLSTTRCRDEWKRLDKPVPAEFRQDCRALLGELMKQAVDDSRPAHELAEFDPQQIHRVFVPCKRSGTAATVYSHIRNYPLRIETRKPDDSDLVGGSMLDLGELAMGAGADAEKDVLQAAWLATKGAPAPTQFTEDNVDDLKDAIAMETELFQRDPFFVVARGPREMRDGGGLAQASAKLGIGLVVHDAENDYAYLAVPEGRLTNLVCKYLQLLETL